MIIDGREIGPGHSPWIVAEIGASHCGSLDKAFALIATAKRVGADSVKFQCYEPSTITIDCDKPDFIVEWQGKKTTLYELYQRAHTPFAWFQRLFASARDLGITPFASVFDATSVDLLEKLGCPAYKIASFEIVDTPLIRCAAATGKPLIISTGMASYEDIAIAVDAVETNSAFLHCVSGYPTMVEDADLTRMLSLPGADLGTIGISDHTLGWEVPVAATAMGAHIIEKHLCLSRDDPSEDSDFSLEPSEFKLMCQTVRSIWEGMQPKKAPTPYREIRRSLYVVQDIAEGELFTKENVRSIRPGYGMHPSQLPLILDEGRAAYDIKRGEPLAMDMIEGWSVTA